VLLVKFATTEMIPSHSIHSGGSGFPKLPFRIVWTDAIMRLPETAVKSFS
jgi:hypothetical protein